MRGEEKDGALLAYILRSIALIDEYTAGGKEAFLSQSMVHDAAMRRLETLGDAASQLSDELKLRHPATPWREIRGFRNVAAHDYQHIDLSRVWDTIERHLPALKTVVEAEIKRLAKSVAGEGGTGDRAEE